MRIITLICLCIQIYSIGWSQPSLREQFQSITTEQQKISIQHTLNHYFDTHPDLEKRLIDPHYKIPNEMWSYGSQTYRNREVMLHLITSQVQAMTERNEIDSIKEVFDERYGIGSKSHKDKGAINNPLSFFGHPIQKEILGQNSRRKSLQVYHAFRLTIKNELIQFSRNQSLEWHLQDDEKKLQDTLNYLKTQHPQEAIELKRRLEEYDIKLESLLRKAFTSHLLS